MTPKNLDQPAPLRVWAGALGITTVLIGLFVYVFGYAFDPHLSPGLFQNAHPRLVALGATRDATRVVLLGRSAFAFETFGEPGLARAADEAGEGPMRFVRVIAQQQSLDALEPILQDIVAAHPDMVVLDLPTLLTDVRLADRLLLGRMYFWSQIFGHGRWIRETSDDFNPTCKPADERRATLKHDVQGMVDHFASETLATDGRSFARARRLVHDLIKQGARVALITSHVDPALEAHLHRSTDPELHAAAVELLATPGVEEWVPPVPRPIVDFCDPFHAAPTWRPVFARWLVDHIASSVPSPAQAKR